MKKLLYLIIALLPVSFASCSDDDDKVVEPSASGTMTDDEGNEYGWVRIGNLDWTTSNALNGVPMYEYTFFDEQWWTTPLEDQEDYVINEYMPVYGNLLTWDDAMACVPDGWRIPTDEDWKNLERALGSDDVDSSGIRGNVGNALMAKDSGSRLGLTLGGCMIGVRSYGWISKNLERVKEYGYYWTSTVGENKTGKETAYYRKVIFGNNGVQRNAIECGALLNVRWCRDAQ